jgi:exonuclease SbcC
MSAKLLDENKRVIADTVEEVDLKLQSILGYSYDTFADSFYLMQKELTAPNNDSIKNMVGISEYYTLIEECITSNQDITQQLQQLQPQLEQRTQDINDIGLDETWLPDLVESREMLEKLNNNKQKYLHLLDQTLNAYPQDQPPYRKILPRYTFFNTLSNILFPLMLLVWLFWTGLEFFPQYMQLLPVELPENSKILLFNTGISITAFYASCLFYSWWLDGKVIAPLQRKASETRNILKGALQHIQQTDGNIPERIKIMLINIAQTPHLIPTTALRNVTNRNVINNISQYSYDIDAASDALKDIQHALIRQRNHINYHQGVLGDAIDTEMERTHRAGTLRKEHTQIKQHIQQHQRHHKVNDYAIKLLDTAAEQFLSQFNQVITQSSSRILPSFTNRRYIQLKIDTELNVEIYAKQAAHFVNFDEVSSGTQRQVMLSLRFAMSEQLAINKNNQQQFILLDEPFAFFDQQRTCETLAALAKVSDVVNQVWVFSQEFPKDIEVAKAIHCKTKTTKLCV